MAEPLPLRTEDISFADLQASNKALKEQNDQLVLAFERLTRNEADLVAMVDVLDAMLWSVDDQLNFRSINEMARQRMSEVHGITPRTGDPFAEVIKDLDKAAAEFWKDTYAKALGGERVTFLYELTLPSDTGQLTCYSFNSFNPINVNGKVVGVSCLAQDITERVNTARVLEASEKRFRALTERGHDMITIRSESGEVIYDSPSKYRILGYNGDEEGMPVGFEMAHGEDRLLIDAAFERSLSSPGKNIPQQFRVLQKDGSVMNVMGYVTNMLDVPEVGGLVSNMRDVTELLSITDQLRTSEVRFRALIEGSADGIMLTDANFNISYVSPATESILGYAPEEIIGHSADEFITVEQRPKLEALYANILAEPGVPQQMLFSVTHKNGQARWLLIMFKNLMGDSSIGSVVANFRDITERVELHDQMVFDHSNLAALINSTTDPVWSVDADYRLITANQAFLRGVEQLVGYRIAPGQSMLTPDLEGLPISADWFAQFTEAMKGGTVSVERYITQPVEAWMEFQYSPIVQNDEVVGVACFSRNITSQRMAQRDLERSLAQTVASEREKTIILDALPANIALLDGSSTIVAVNAAWREFAQSQGYLDNDHGFGRSYLEVSRSAAGLEDEMGEQAAVGIELVLSGMSRMFSMEYPCHTPDVERWFRLQVSALHGSDLHGAVVMHVDITDRVLAEADVVRLNVNLEDRVIERTQELHQVNKDLDAEIVKNKLLSDVVNARNLELMSSISYASYIQLALMPEKENFDFFSGMALFSRPRDVLSGDFLWCHDTPEHIIVAVADCTGHGVPGAMLSMLGHESLNSIVLGKEITDPVKILTKLNGIIEQLFVQGKDLQVTDGMDIALVIVEKATLKLSFVGAMLHAVIIRDGEPILLPASKATIGGHLYHYNKDFKRHDLQLHKGDRIALFTDGFSDQFGGPRNKKFFRKNLVHQLLNTSSMPVTEAKEALARRFDEWKVGHEQVDDVTVLLLDI